MTTSGFSLATMISLPFPSPFALLPAALNHLLAAEPWAQRKLAAHAGQTAVVNAGIAAIRLSVLPDGSVRTAAADEKPSVTIHVKPADLPLILQNRDRAFSYVTIDGDAGFAATISQLGQSMRWEAEEDLSRIVGDIAAARIVGGAKAVAKSIDDTRKTVNENVAEYLTEENPMLIRPLLLQQFSGEVVRLRDDVERLAKRIERLQKGNGQ